MKQRRRTKKKKKRIVRIPWIHKVPMDYNLLFALIFLIVFGIIMIYSASYYNASQVYGIAGYSFAVQQARAAVIGIVGMLLISMIDYHVWEKLSFLGFPISFLLILLLKTPLGSESHEATRWLQIGPINFQVAEPVKLLMILFLAAFIKKYPVRHLPNILRVGFCSLLISGMIFVISDNMSTAIIIMGISILLIFLSHPNMKYFAMAAGILLAVIVVAVIGIELFMDGSSGGFRVTRILAWLHPTDPAYASGVALQASQAFYAIGSGGFWGRGLGQSLIKFKMPEPHNDFIFSVIYFENISLSTASACPAGIFALYAASINKLSKISISFFNNSFSSLNNINLSVSIGITYEKSSHEIRLFLIFFGIFEQNVL